MLTLYADFACPYCYVEYELLLRLGKGEAFRFCPVSLLPKSAVAVAHEIDALGVDGEEGFGLVEE